MKVFLLLLSILFSSSLGLSQQVGVFQKIKLLPTTLPTACVLGDLRFDTSANAFNYCSPANTWVSSTTASKGATVSVSSNASYFPALFASSSNSNQPFNLGSGLTFNPSTNVLTTTTFVGALTGAASGNTTYTANNHGIVVSGSGNAMTVIAPDASTTKVLTSGGASADPVWATPTGGSGGINYDSNPGAEVDTSGYATYFDAAGNIPVDCTGGTATNLTFSRNTSTPLIGTGDFKMVQANSTSIQGKGVSYDFTIDPAFKGQVLTASFNYNASSTFVASNGTTAPLNDGTTSTNAGNSDLEFFIYDVTNAVFIPITPQVMTSNGTNNAKYFGTWQTASNSTSYRACWHVASTSANATGWTYKFDNVTIGPQSIMNGPSIGDWKSDLTFTTSGFGTISNSNFEYRRIGDTMHVRGFFTAGTTAASTAYIQLPSGFTIDTSKYIASQTSRVGTLTRLYQSTTANIIQDGFPFEIFYDGSTNNKFFFAHQEASSAYIKTNGNSLDTSGDSQTFEFSIPILGWSSNIDFSNDTDTRVVAANINGTPASASASNPIIYPTVTSDSHGAYNASTGRYTVPVSGTYQINAVGATASLVGSNNINIYKNASIGDNIGWGNASGNFSAAGTVKCVAGDIIDVRPSANTGAFAGSLNSLSIYRLSGPATIAASNTVSMRAYNSATSISGSLATISWTTTDWDDTGSYSAGTWTCPMAGKYQANAELTVSGTIALNNTIDLQLQKNGTAISEDIEYAGGAMTQQQASINDVFRCIPGDTVRVQASSGATLPSIVNSNTKSYLSLIRVGNY